MGVVVEDGVTIGAGACIIPKEGYGLTLGRGCVVGANAVVTKDVPPGAVAVGPGADIRQRTPRTSTEARYRRSIGTTAPADADPSA